MKVKNQTNKELKDRKESVQDLKMEIEMIKNNNN